MTSSLVFIIAIVGFGGWLNDWSVGWFLGAFICIGLGALTHRNLT